MNGNCFDCHFDEFGLQERNQRTRNLETQNEWIPMQMQEERNVLISTLNGHKTPGEKLYLKNGEENVQELNLTQKPERRRKGKDKTELSSQFPNPEHLVGSYSVNAKPPDESQNAANEKFSALKIKQNEGTTEEMDVLSNVFLGALLGFGQLVLVGLLLDILWNIVWTMLHVTSLILMTVLPTLVGIGILVAVVTVTFSALTKLAMEH